MELLQEALAEVVPGWILIFKDPENDKVSIGLQKTCGLRVWIFVGELRKDAVSRLIYFRDLENVESPIHPSADSGSGISVEVCLLRGLSLALRAVF